MTVRAIGGLVVFNTFVLAAGAGALWGIRGWRFWTDFVRLAGVAYLLGIACLMVLLTFEIVVGVPVNGGTIALTGLVLALVGLAVGRLRRHAPPGIAPAGWRVPRLSLFSALFLAGLLVYLEGLFRSERLAGVVNEWDSWSFWMPKAGWIYYSGGLDSDFLQEIPAAPYPPGMSSIHAAGFHAMGSVDTATIHLQYWFVASGFVAAVLGLLARRVPPAIVLPVLLAALVAPSLVARMMTTYADVPLGYLIAVGALLIALWLHEQRGWQLGVATVLLSGAMLTKREGMLFVACVMVAAFVASWTDRRIRWPRLAISGLVVIALTLPWRLWFTAQGIPGDGPESGYLGSLRNLDRVWPSLELVVRTLFDQDLWPVISVVAGAAVVLAGLARAVRISVYAGTFVVSAVLACGWAIWSNPSLEFSQRDDLNPIVRLTGTTILTLAAITPLVLHRAWSEAHGAHDVVRVAASPGPDALLTRSGWAWAIVAIGLLSHPGAMLVGYSGSGLPGGMPRFPGPSDCIAARVGPGAVRLVLGYAESYAHADSIRRRARGAGLASVEIAQDGCGRLRVFVDGLPSVAAARRGAAIARASGLAPSLEASTLD